MKRKIEYTIIIVLSIILLLLISYFTYNFFVQKNYSNMHISKDIRISKDDVKISKYVIYGTHLNIYGKLKLNENIFNKNSIYELVMIDENKNEILIPTISIKSENYFEFCTSKSINQGIYLDGISPNNYSLYIKETLHSFSIYHKLVNKTKYDELEYYTITRNNTNNKLNILFNETLEISCKNEKLPSKYYDIVIDQGHGGKSTGAIFNGYTESLLTYDLGKKLQKSLENLGLKVLTTRNDINETVDDYGENGRVVIPNKVKAKYSFSIHLNASEVYDSWEGVEIYCPSRADLTLGKMLSDNIIHFTNSSVSPNTYGKYKGGIYVLTFNETVINECYDEALQDGYEPYKIFLDTPLFFMIREVGGISTSAYTDGRNLKVGKNLYYDSNQTAEGYLLELGYISNKDEIEKIINNKEKYVEAITKSIKDYLGL